MIQIKDLSKKFDSRGIAGVQKINFNISAGEVFAILGPNGSGKTTLLKLIAQEMTPDSGSVESHLPIKFCHFSINVKDQNVLKFLLENIIIQIDEEKKLNLARDLADIFEFTFQLKQNLSSLSAGQLQKVLLAKELINNPKTIILDEPFAHLDPLTRRDILKNLFDYLKNQEITLIWVTHDRNEAFYFSDRIAVLNFGKVEQLGTPSELMWSPRNLFIAQYVGHENFVAVKRITEGTWSTPWGEKNFKFKARSDDALMIIPSLSWQIDEHSPVIFDIAEFKIFEQSWRILAHYEQNTFYIHLGPHDFKSIQAQKLVRLSPYWEDCFLIDL